MRPNVGGSNQTRPSVGGSNNMGPNFGGPNYMGHSTGGSNERRQNTGGFNNIGGSNDKRQNMGGSNLRQNLGGSNLRQNLGGSNDMGGSNMRPVTGGRQSNIAYQNNRSGGSNHPYGYSNMGSVNQASRGIYDFFHFVIDHERSQSFGFHILLFIEKLKMYFQRSRVD